MTDTPETAPIVVQLYCRIELTISDPDAVTSRAAEELRTAGIDWADEPQTLEQAVAEMRADLLQSVAGLFDPDAAVSGIPGAEIRGGRWWAESGPPSDVFNPGFGA